jgi:hypothetical protein
MMNSSKITTYGALAYVALSGLALISAGCAKAFPKVSFFATAANVLGIVALDVKKLVDYLSPEQVKS